MRARRAHAWARSAASRPTSSIPTRLPARVELLRPARRRARRGSTARRRGPTARCCASTSIFAVDREIEIAPGVFFPAWTYNGQVPGPTIRATEGDRVRVTFLNQGSHPHTIHFHGWHPPEMDGSLPEHQVMPGDTFVYEFDAEPFGLHLYHCHAVPLKRHIHKGLYGVFIVDPQDAAAAGRRAGDGDERLRHELRRRQRGLRRQHRRAPLHARADSRRRSASWCASISSTSPSSICSTASTCTACSSTSFRTGTSLTPTRDAPTR